jgi:uridine kinase
MPRPILLGVVGDSGSGKTTLTRGLVRILGEPRVAHVSADHYHRYDRRQRLGEFSVGSELHRSESLAITQLLLLYQLLTARAAIAVGADGARAVRPLARA